MNTPTILPELDLNVLQAKANEYAMKGALKSIEEYYSGYDSPFRKAIEDELKTKELGYGINLPDIIGILNTSLSKEIDNIANAAIAQTYIPHINKFLTRAKPEMMFSEVLKEFIATEYDIKISDCEIYVDEHKEYKWLNVEMQLGDKEYKFTLHTDHSQKKDDLIKKYQFLGLPDESTFTTKMFGGGKRVMTLKMDGAILELPFMADILKDKVTSFIATLIIAKTKITIDTREFSEDMFPEDKCHCD